MRNHSLSWKPLKVRPPTFPTMGQQCLVLFAFVNVGDSQWEGISAEEL